MIARTIGVGITCAPLISALLLGLGRAGRTLTIRTRWNRSSRTVPCARHTGYRPRPSTAGCALAAACTTTSTTRSGCDA